MKTIENILKKHFTHVSRVIDEKMRIDSDFEKMMMNIINNLDAGQFKTILDTKTKHIFVSEYPIPDASPYYFNQRGEGVSIATPYGNVLIYNTEGTLCLDINNSDQGNVIAGGQEILLHDLEYPG